MHCWKSVNREQHYSGQQIFCLSCITFVLTFALLYVPFSFVFGVHSITDDYFYLFILLAAIIYPLHKLIHVFGLYIIKEKFSVSYKKNNLFIYEVQVRGDNPIQKWKYIFALLLPFIVLNSSFLIAIFLFPNFGHYITVLLAYHTAVCMTDFITLKTLMTSPPNSVIEENEEGFEILTEADAENETEAIRKSSKIGFKQLS